VAPGPFHRFKKFTTLPLTQVSCNVLCLKPTPVPPIQSVASLASSPVYAFLRLHLADGSPPWAVPLATFFTTPLIQWTFFLCSSLVHRILYFMFFALGGHDTLNPVSSPPVLKFPSIIPSALPLLGVLYFNRNPSTFAFVPLHFGYPPWNFSRHCKDVNLGTSPPSYPNGPPLRQTPFLPTPAILPSLIIALCYSLNPGEGKNRRALEWTFELLRDRV